MASSADFKTPICRFSYVHNMFTPVKRENDDGTPMLDKDGNQVVERQCTLIFPVSVSKDVFDKAIMEAVTTEWPSDGLVQIKNKLIRSPYLLGDGPEAHSKKTGELHPGMGADVWFIRVATRRVPAIRYRSEHVPATPEEIKSGDYGFAAIHAYTWDYKKKGRGVSFGISYLQKKLDGDPLGSSAGVNASDYFEKIADEGAAPASTKTGEGAGGLFG